MGRRLGWALLLLCIPSNIQAQQTQLAVNTAQPQPRVVNAVDERLRVKLHGNTHPLLRQAFDEGAAPVDLPMQRMTLVLKRSPDQEKRLRAHLTSLQDKSSPNYHRWLTPEEFGAKFGVAQNDVDAIRRWLRSYGLTPERVSNNRLIIEFSGTAAQVEQALHTEIRTYKVGGRRYYSNAGDPEIPEALSPVIAGIASINNFASRASAHLAGRGTGLNVVGSRTKPAFTFLDQLGTFKHAVVPFDLQTIYNAAPLLSSNITGSGQKIAIAARSNISPEDFHDFRALFQPFARQNALQIVVNGPDPGLTYDDDMVEATADAEYAGALAPDADIVLVVSASTNDMDGIALSALYAVDNNIAPVLSLSYGACESALGAAGNQFYSELWQQAAAQGITVVVASGDAGPAGCEQPFASGDSASPVVASQGTAVNGLASTPYNIAVGGTQFNEVGSDAYWDSSLNVAYGSALSYIPEVAWNESCSPYACAASNSNFTASAGGPSSCTAWSVGSNRKLICTAHHPKPEWQTGLGTADDGSRDLPDISLTSAVHDGYVLCFAGSCKMNKANGAFDFYITGGTSLSAPVFGGVMALVNQKTASPQGQAAAVLYALAASQVASHARCDASAPSSEFDSCTIRDVTSGNSNIPCSGGSPGCSETASGLYGTLPGYAASEGYDMATGLGSINVANLVNNWTAGNRAATQTSLSISPVLLQHGQKANVIVSVVPQSAQGTPTGDIVVLTSSGNPSSAATARQTLFNGTFSGSLSSLPGGTYDVSARYAGDTDFAASTSSSFTVTVQPENSTTELNLRFSSGDSIPNGGTVPYGSRIVANAHALSLSGTGVATGTITFSGTVPPPGAPIFQSMPLNNTGTIEASTVLSSIGNYTFSATYSGDESLHPSSSQLLRFSVVKATPTVFASTATPSVGANGEVQINVRITTTSLSTAGPSGKAILMLGNTQLQSATVYACANNNSDLACSMAEMNIPANKLNPGTNALTVVYSGDPHHNAASASSPVTITVAPPDQLPGAIVDISLSVSSSAVQSGEVVTLSSTVTHGLQPVTGGTVTFFSGTRKLGTVQVVGMRPAPSFQTGTGTLKTRLPAGSHSVMARYNGLLATYQPAVSSIATVNVKGNIPTQARLTAKENPQILSDYDLTVSVLGGSAALPAGKVDFHDLTTDVTLGQAELKSSDLPFALSTAQRASVDGQPFADAVSVTAADLNADGIPDAVTANSTDNSVSILLGKEDGTFDAASQFPLGSGATQVLIMDANQDGIPDIVTATTLGAVQLLIGNGDGTFHSGTSTLITDPPLGLLQGDFNNDGIPDLAVYSAVTPSIFASPCIFVLLGMGDGTFGQLQTYTSGEIVTGLTSADFNRDGVLDLVASGPTGLYMLAGRSDGTFRAQPTRPYDGTASYLLSQVSSPLAADFNQDGVTDIAMIPDMVPYQVLVITGNADGSFHNADVLSPPGFNYFDTSIDQACLAITDINADGVPDVVQMLAGISNGKTITALYLYAANGDGTFSNPKPLTVAEWVDNPLTSFALADLNGDGLDDILATTRLDPSAALTSALLHTQTTATLTISLGSSSETVQATYTPDAGSAFSPSISNTLTLRRLLPSTSTLQYGYKDTLGNCILGGASSAIFWSSVPCFYLHVTPRNSASTTLTGTVILNGTNPSGGNFSAGPYSTYPDGSGGAGVYVFYNYGLGDAGIYTFSMSYTGDETFQASSSAILTIPLQPLPTTVTLSGPQRLLAGNSAILSAQVASPLFPGAHLSGPISLYDGQALLQRSQVSSNAIIFEVPALRPGAHLLTVKFDGLLGQFNFLNTASSVSTPLLTTVYEAVPQQSPEVALTVVPEAPVLGEQVTFKAVVSQSGRAATNGTVTFLDGTTPLATVPILTGAEAGTTAVRKALSIGRHSISARYNALTYVETSHVTTLPAAISERHDVTVSSPAPSETTLVARTSTANRQAYELSASVFAYGPIPPIGHVLFEDTTANVPIGSVALKAAQAHPAYSAPTPINFSGKANLAVAADFNNDGITDLAVAESEACSIHLLLGDTGSPFSQIDYNLPAAATAAIAADINRNNIPDLLLGTANNEIIPLLFQDGGLQQLKSAATSFIPGRLLTGDLNGDGTLDLVVAGQAGTTNLAVLSGTEKGSFGPPTRYAIPKLAAGYSVELNDVNGDGVLDILLVTGNDATYLLLGVGDGSFQMPLHMNDLNGGVIAADLNGDAIPDLAFTPAPGVAAIQLGRGNNIFTPLRYYPSAPLQPSEPYSPTAISLLPNPIAIADFNGDGIPDLITPGMILLGVGDGTFNQQNSTPQVGFSALADLNADGFPDLMSTATGTLEVQYGGTVSTVTLDAAKVSGSGMHNVRATFIPSTGVPYFSSESNSLQLQAYHTIATVVDLQQSFPANGNATYGQRVTLTANVVPSTSGTPTGEVIFSVDGTAQQQSPLSPNRTAQWVTENLSGGTHRVSAAYSGDSTFAPSSNSLTMKVLPAASTVLLSSSNDHADPGSSVMFTAHVQGQGGMARPTGTIQFLDGTTLVGVATLNSGAVAAHSSRALSPGIHDLTASYSGDSNFAAAISSVFRQTITAPDFQVSADPSSLALATGESAVIMITATAVGGYSGSLNLACAGLPPETICSFASPTLILDGTNTVRSTQLTIAIAPRNSAVLPLHVASIPAAWSSAALLLGWPGLLVLGNVVKRSWRLQRFMPFGTTATFCAALLLLFGCGGTGKQTDSVPPHASTYTIPVTASAGNATHAVDLTLLIQ